MSTSDTATTAPTDPGETADGPADPAEQAVRADQVDQADPGPPADEPGPTGPELPAGRGRLRFGLDDVPALLVCLAVGMFVMSRLWLSPKGRVIDNWQDTLLFEW